MGFSRMGRNNYFPTGRADFPRAPISTRILRVLK